MKRYLLIILFVLPLKLVAQHLYTQECKEIYHEIIWLRLDTAKQMISNAETKDLDNFYFVYLKNYIDFLTLVIGEDDRAYDSLKNIYEYRRTTLKSYKEKSAELLMIRAEMNLQSSFIKLKFNEYWSAGLDFYRSYKLAKEINAEYPDFLPNKKLIGLFHLVIGTIPDEYRLIVEVVGLEGDINQGLKELNQYYKYVNNDPDKAIEAMIYCAFGYQFFAHDNDLAIKFLDRQNNVQLNNSLLRFTYVSALLKAGRTDKAIDILTRYKQSTNEYPFHQLKYQLGLAKLYRLDDDAKIYIKLFLESFKGRHHIKSAWQKLAWCYYLDNNSLKYNEAQENVHKYGHSTAESDKQAIREVSNGSEPNKTLLEARLLFDGGYYERARKLLDNKELAQGLNGPIEKLEFLYRKARLSDHLGEKEDAIKLYKTVIENGKDVKRYFAPYSALKIGEMYEKENEPELAQEYYKKCLSINNSEYKNSIEQKAKAGLNRIKSSTK